MCAAHPALGESAAGRASETGIMCGPALTATRAPALNAKK
jgi:hypothetical protein